MTVISSSVPAAKLALHDALQAWTWEGVTPTVRYGYPSESEDVSERFVCLGDTTFQSPATALRDARRPEEYVIQIICEARAWGDDEAAVEAEAWQLYANVIALIWAEQQPGELLNGTISHFSDRTVRQRNVVSGPQQWLSQIVVEQTVVAYVPNV